MYNDPTDHGAGIPFNWALEPEGRIVVVVWVVGPLVCAACPSSFGQLDVRIEVVGSMRVATAAFRRYPGCCPESQAKAAMLLTSWPILFPDRDADYQMLLQPKY